MRLAALFGLFFATATCIGDPASPPGSPPVAPLEEPKPRIDSRLTIPLGSSGVVTDGTTLQFTAVTGPTHCDGNDCYVEPVTAHASITHSGATRQLAVTAHRFERYAPLVVGYLAPATADTSGTLVGHFRVAEEFPVTQPLGQFFRLSVTMPAVLPSDRTLRLTAFEDNRCPCNAVCVWEGLAQVEISLFAQGQTVGKVKFDDHVGKLNEQGPSTGTVGDLTLSAKTVVLPACQGHIDEGYIELKAE